MNLTLRAVLCVSVLSASLSSAKADGPTDYPGYEDVDPNQVVDPNSSQVYQPPPEGVCFDDENQSYDCSKDDDYQSYSNIDDGYDPSAHEDFRDALAPYGQWVQTAQYGNVWVPAAESVGPDFTPYYSGGRWNYTDYGWTWVSEYNWGWAPFHYGRWITLPGYGWSWVPGRIWGPAWVHWRSGGGYVGWAPLPPRGVVIARPAIGARWHYWNFVGARDIMAPRLLRVAPSYMPNVYGRTVITTDFRSIGTTRVIVGPPLHHFPGVRVVPAPLGSLQIALPRSHIVVRPGVPLGSRTYYSPYARPTWNTHNGGVVGPRPGYPPVYSRPGYPPPYQRPGYPPPYQRPGYPPPYPQQPPGQQRPGYPPPYQQQPPIYNRPGYPAPYPQQPPGQQRPGYPPPYQHPGQQQPVHQGPVFRPGPHPPEHPAPMPGQPPIQQRPGGWENRPGGWENRPGGWENRPGQQPPVHQPPVFPQPGHDQPPVHQRPSFEQRPAPPPVQPPVYQRPSFEQRPSPPPSPPVQPPVYQRPSFEQRPSPSMPAPVRQAPVHQAPVFQPSHSAPPAAPGPRPVAPPANFPGRQHR